VDGILSLCLPWLYTQAFHFGWCIINISKHISCVSVVGDDQCSFFGGRFHLVDDSYCVGCMQGRFRVPLVGLSDLYSVIDAEFAIVCSRSFALRFLLFEDLRDGFFPTFLDRAAADRVPFEAPQGTGLVKAFLVFFEEFDRAPDFGPSAVPFGTAVPAVGDFLFGVFGDMDDSIHLIESVKGDGLFNFCSSLIVEESNLVDSVKGGGLFGVCCLVVGESILVGGE